jgi:serine/threonine protein kinase
MNDDPKQQPSTGDRTTPPELDDPRVIEALDEYLAALETGKRPSREAFLARHSDIAPALAECLDGMEALHEASSSSPQPVGGPALAPDWQPGTPLGDFRILREVGRGGMGVVYEAEQLSLGRRIALKVLPFALTLDPKQLQRFKNEARAAAQLHHQHIVPVYFVGSERGVHFYAMQFIEGQSLAEVIHGLRQRTGGKTTASPAAATGGRGTSRAEPTGPLVPPRSGAAAADTAVDPVGPLATAYSTNSAQFYRSVARLGVQAAEALEHAHEYGVVHRDIKPANLLVDAHGHLWVTDFGLAQFAADAGLTQTGDLLGTLRYMSPEQAGGQRLLVDHRTDVYSLGATLYELLTLRPPFDGADRQTLLHQILHDEPRPLRAIEKSVPAELETIVLKALNKTPAERYATAREFADDLGRFLHHQPIRARRATLAQRVRKWGRRHPSVVVAAFVVCVLTTVVSLASAALIRREEARTAAAYTQERQRAREAEERFQLARDAVDEMLKVCEQELADGPQFDGLRRRLLEDALAYYQKLIDQRGDDPKAQQELEATRTRARKILADLAVLQGAGQLHLLKEPAVLDDLQLDEGQRTKINDLLARADLRRTELFGESHPRSPDEWRRRILELARVNDAEVNTVLTPEQRQRLGQIALQAQGPGAFREADIAASLKLTADQRERIRGIEAETFVCGQERKGAGVPPADFQKARDDKLRVANARIQAVLTPEQKQRWRAMTGEPFRGPLPHCRPGLPGHFGPPPGPPPAERPGEPR